MLQSSTGKIFERSEAAKLNPRSATHGTRRALVFNLWLRVFVKVHCHRSSDLSALVDQPTIMPRSVFRRTDPSGTTTSYITLTSIPIQSRSTPSKCQGSNTAVMVECRLLDRRYPRWFLPKRWWHLPYSEVAISPASKLDLYFYLEFPSGRFQYGEHRSYSAPVDVSSANGVYSVEGSPPRFLQLGNCSYRWFTASQLRSKDANSTPQILMIRKLFELRNGTVDDSQPR